MRLVLFGVGLFLFVNQASAEDEAVAKAVRQLDVKQPKQTRLEAAKWLNRHATRGHPAVPALKRSVISDPDPQVRSEAIKALALIVFQKQETRICPIEVFRAWDDKDADVRMWARTYTTLFVLKEKNKPHGRLIAHFPKQATPILLRHAGSKDGDVRAEAVMKLGYLAHEDANAMKAVRKAERDREWWVRYHAALALRNATGDEYGLLRHQIGLLARLNSRKPISEAEAKKLPPKERYLLYRGNVLQLGIPLQFGELAKDRPKETANFLLKLLRDESAATRKETIAFLDACWAMPEAPRARDLTALDFISGGKKLLPKKGQTVPIGTWLTKFGLLARLQVMSRSDDDASVRKAAESAVFRIRRRMSPSRK